MKTNDFDSSPRKTLVQTVKTATCETDWFRFGSGKKSLVVLPGLSVQSVTDFAQQIANDYAALASDFTVYVFDRRKNLPPVYSVAEMAQDAVEAIRAVVPDRFSVFGASQGGMIAMEIALRHPELVEKLILGSTSAQVTDGDFQIFDDWIKLAEANESAKLTTSFCKAVYPPETFEKIKPTFAQNATAFTSDQLQRFAVLARAMKGFDVTKRLCDVSCPVLVLGDKSDGVFGIEATLQIAEILKSNPHCQTHVYQGYGHAAYDVAPDYKLRMLQFLTND